VCYLLYLGHQLQGGGVCSLQLSEAAGVCGVLQGSLQRPPPVLTLRQLRAQTHTHTLGVSVCVCVCVYALCVCTHCERDCVCGERVKLTKTCIIHHQRFHI